MRRTPSARSSVKRCNKNISEKKAAPDGRSRPVLPRPVQVYPRVGQRVGLPQNRKIQPISKVAKNKGTPPNPFGFDGVWWRLLDSNQWPHACEYSMREAVTCFPLRPALLDPDFMVLGCCLVHRLRTVFSCSGSGCGSARRVQFLNLMVDGVQRTSTSS